MKVKVVVMCGQFEMKAEHISLNKINFMLTLIICAMKLILFIPFGQKYD